MSAVNPGVYKAILQVREARSFDLGCFLMRFYAYMSTIGTVTMLTLSGYSFFLAGLVSSAIALATFFISPRVSKLIDEYGQSRVVPLAAVVTMVGLALMLTTVALKLPTPLLFVAAIIMGFVPNAQALPRARWTYLIHSGRLGRMAPELRTMFSYEGVLDDIGFMFGPSASIALAAAIAPTAGMLTGGISFAVGTTILCLSRSTEPVPGWSEAHAAAKSAEDVQGAEVAEARAVEVTKVPVTTKEVVETMESAPATTSSKHYAKSIIRTSPIVRVLFVLMIFVGAFYGVFDTATIALAEEVNDPNIASTLLILSGIVSMFAGFFFGMVNLRVAQYKQLIAAAAFIGFAYGTMMIIDSVPELFVVGTVAAVAYAPFLIVANAACERAVPGGRITEAITWMNAGITCGMAFGPTAGGAIIDWFGATASFDFGALMALAIPVTAFACFRIIKRDVRDSVYEVVSETKAQG